MDAGIEKAGFHTICAIESDQHCAATLKNNARRKEVWKTDIRAIDPSRMLDIFGMQKGECALLHGGPPCQPFSQMGKKEGLGDPRGLLVFEMVRFAKSLRPAAVMIEQVPNFFRASVPDGSLLLEFLTEEFGALGYDVFPTILDASFYGVAQRRKRAFIVCVPSGQDFHFPIPCARVKMAGEALDGLPHPARRGEKPLVANHIDVTPDRDRERISYVPEGLWLSKSPNVPPGIMQRLTRKDTTKFRRLARNELSPTLRCGEPLYHPTENRYITPREAARIQGFPDGHVFSGPLRGRTGVVRDLDQHRQVANAVPPPLAQAVASRINDALCL